MATSHGGGYKERMRRMREPSYDTLQAEHSREDTDCPPVDVIVHCGWGRLLLAHTFSDNQTLIDALQAEQAGERDIALYVANPHVLLSLAPQSLFLDPSDTLRLWMNHYRPRSRALPGVVVRRATSVADVEAINLIYKQRKMVPLKHDVVLERRRSKQLVYLVAEDSDGQILGTVMGVNHVRVFDDPYKGSSLWCLAVATDCHVSGVGEGLVRYLAEYFQARGCQYLDLSVMHDNLDAKRLYERLGFQQIRTFAMKCKNAINERLFLGPEQPSKLNPYAQIIIDEALRRGIQVDVDDADQNVFTLTQGGRQIRCHESLTDLTSSVSMTLCQNKLMTHRCLARELLRTPSHLMYDNDENAEAFLNEHGSVVVKPLTGEQGKGISVDIRSREDLFKAIDFARQVSDDVLLETFHPGDDLRIVVIGYEVVAAAIRRPAEVFGNGKNTIRQLVEKQSRRRAAATGGESQIPQDAETERCLRDAGYTWDSILSDGQSLRVRKTANLHTGGTLVDVTDQLNPYLAERAVKAAKALQIPVVGLDFLVLDPAKRDYVIIEANERPGLENHAPQPTAARFMDLLFPHSVIEENKNT